MLPADRLILVLLALLFSVNCGATIAIEYRSGAGLQNLAWESGQHEIPWATDRPDGGSYTTQISHITPSWRRFGPGTPNAVSELIERLNIPLLATHPITGKTIPMLADRWFTDETAGISYFHIDDKAFWSDDIPVTSNDFAYTVQFLTDESRGTVYQADILEADIQSLIVYDPGYFAIRHAPGPMPELIRNFKPLPAHFYQSDIRWPGGFDDTPEPVTGPYNPQGMDFDSINLTRVANWWGDNQRFLRQRFHVTDIRLVREGDSLYRAFANGEIDLLSTSTAMALTSPWAITLSERYHINRLICQGCPTQYSGLLFSPDVADEDRLRLIQAIDTLLREKHADVTTEPASESMEEPAAAMIEKPRPPLAPDLTSPDTDSEPIVDVAPMIAEPALLEGLIFPSQSSFDGLSVLPGAVAEPAESLRRRIEEGNYRAVLITARANGRNAHKALTEAATAYHTKGVIAALSDISYHHYVFWEWLQIPIGAPISHYGVFDPFDAVYGGMFSVDKKLRAEHMNHPERDIDDVIPAVINYP